MLAVRGDQDWAEIDQARDLPDGTAAARLCVEVTAGDGTAWFKGLNLLGPAEAP